MKSHLKAFATASLAALSFILQGQAVPPQPQQTAPTAAANPAEPPQSAQPTQSATQSDGWPRQFTAGDQDITVYQPQIESWKQNKLEQRAVVSIQTKATAEPTFGVIWINSRTEVDKSNHQVTLEDTEITKASFPSAPDKADDYLSSLRKEVPGVIRPMSLDRLQASLAITKAEARGPETKLKNEPPQIIYSQHPGILVLIDGKPVLRDAGAGGLLRVINTRALIVLDQKSGNYYFYLGDHWMTSTSLDTKTEWKPAEDLAKNPKGPLNTALNQVKTRTSQAKEVDLLNEDPSLVTQLKKGAFPHVYVSTKPAELIQTSGSPQFFPISDTQILYVKNTQNDIFLNTGDQNYYITVSGRWYRAKSLDGPWNFVAASKLPQDFAKIPENHPKGTVLASVANTPQAKEAEISNEIPQTATISRQQAGIAVSYDGAPNFRPIEGTPLQYAMNTATPVIEVNPQAFYSVQNGVWFVATQPQGPWAVATEVPSVIYSIPPSSPLYYVTYVHVYGSTPQVVYTGYYPGYLGSYIDPDGVVVYGTGYYYQPWIGSVWYGWPLTFGFGIGWGAGFFFGFNTGFYGGFFGPCFHPWWGPYGYAWNHGFHGGYPGGGFYRPVGPGARSFAGNHFNINNTNVYNNWNRNVVRTSAGRTTAFNRTAYNNARPNNLYADRDGNVYRHTGTAGAAGGGNWERYNKSANGTGSWEKSTRPSGPVTHAVPGATGIHSLPTTSRNEGVGGGNQSHFESPPHEVEQEQQARQTGENRANQFHQQAGSSGGEFNHSAPSAGGSGFSRGAGVMGGGMPGTSGHTYIPMPSGPSGGSMGGHMGGFGGGGHMGGGGRH